MPTNVRVQHTYNHKSSLAIDAVVNTFYFQNDLTLDPGTEGGEDLVDVVGGFYDALGLPNSLLPIRYYIAEGSLAAQRHTFKLYNMADAKPRSPFHEITTSYDGANNTGDPGPAEVALCLSYRAPKVSGTNPARRRGRVYLGPLTTVAYEEDASGHCRPTLGLRNTIVQSAKRMQDQAATAGWTWVVHSGGYTTEPESGPNGGTFGEVRPDEYAAISDVWVDDAWDTQRRRGPKPSMRTALAV